MRKIFSVNTGKEVPIDFKTDVAVQGDGEGGILLSMCWHEMRNLGSVMARISPERCAEFLEHCQEAIEDRDA